MNRIDLPRHWPNATFQTVNNELVVGNLPLKQLAQRVGSTPFYAYDQQLITQRIAFLRQHLPKELDLRYAIKANPMPDVVSHLSELVNGFDVSSIKEMEIALLTKTPPANISFSGPGKTDEEIFFAVKSGLIVNLESEHQWHLVIAAQQKLGIPAKVAVRINPDFEVKGSKMKMGGGAKQFGVDSALVPGLLQKIAESNIAFAGFHIFSGSQNLNAQAVTESFKNSCELSIRLARTTPAKLQTLVIGGGFGIPYFPGDTPLDLPMVGEKIKEMLPTITAMLPDVKITIELGRYIVGETGIYVTRIIDRKVSHGHIFLITDGGMNHHLAASGHLGQVIRKNYPVALGHRMQDKHFETVSVVGPLCTPLDLLADRIQLPRAEIGDLIVIFQSGAYGLTASPIEFLGHPRPAEILVKNNSQD